MKKILNIMKTISEFLVKKHQQKSKEYPLITLEDLYDAEDYHVLFAYQYEYSTRKVLEGYIISTDKQEIIDIVDLKEFKRDDIWGDEVYDKVKKIINEKAPNNNVDFKNHEKGKIWILQASILNENVKGHDDQKYYDIR